MQFPKKVMVCEEGTRDGFQTTDKFIPTEEKIKLIEMIVDAGYKAIEVGSLAKRGIGRQGDTDKVFKGLKMKKGVEYRALVEDSDGIRMALESGCKEVKITLSASEAHNRAEMAKSTTESVEGLKECGRVARDNGVRIMGSISLPFISQWEGLIPLDTIKSIVNAFLDAGATEISLSDTSGLGNPALVYQRIMDLREAFPQVSWMIHFHNTRGVGLANVVAALQAGVARIDSSFAGTGGCPYIKGATGNISSEDLLFMLHGMGIETGIDFEKAMAIGQYVEKLVNGYAVDSYQLRLRKIEEANKDSMLIYSK